MAQEQSQSPQFAHSGGYSSGVSEFETPANRMSPEERETARKAAQFGWGPLARASQHSPSPYSSTAPAFNTGNTHPTSLTARAERQHGNPSPLGLLAFALTMFLFSLINLGTRHIDNPAIIVGPALGYGGLVQLLCGMWELALGSTFAATALSSFAGFWISTGIIFTPGGFQVQASYLNDPDGFEQAFALFFFTWMVLIFFLLLGTIRTNAAYFLLFLLFDLTLLFLACAYQNADVNTGKPHTGLLRAGGAFGALTAFSSWYNALVGLLDTNNSFFTLPLVEFPWSVPAQTQSTAASDRTGLKA